LSNQVSATTIKELQAPTGLSLNKNVENQLTLTWDSVDQADGYYVLKSQSTGTTVSDYTPIADTTSTSYTDSGLEDGERYYYRVQSYQSSGVTELSRETSKTTQLPGYSYNKPFRFTIDFTLEDNTTVPNSNINFNFKEQQDLDALINDRGNVVLEWQRVDDSVDGAITIQRSSDSGETWNTLDTVAYDTTTYEDTTVTTGDEYYYRIVRYTDHTQQTSSKALPYKIYYRSSSIGIDQDVQTTREPVVSYRTATIADEGYQQSFADLQDVFPPEESIDITWDYVFDPRGFASEWVYEDSDIPRDERGGFGVNFYGELRNEINVWIQYDEDGDGEAEYTSQKQTIRNVINTPVFDDKDVFNEDGYYRVFIRGLRQEDTVNQVDMGHTYENL